MAILTRWALFNTDAVTVEKYAGLLSPASPAFVFPVPRFIPTAGLDPQEQWKSISYIPYEMMHKKWQYHLLKMLRENVSDPAIEKDTDRAWREYPNGFVAFLQDGEVPLVDRDWHNISQSML